jgi:DNA-binding Xre family transcriptional regulator
VRSTARTSPVTVGPQMARLYYPKPKGRDMTDLIGAAPTTGGRLSICESGLQAGLAPVWPGDRARRWFAVADGQRLRQLRHEQRLSQEALASRAGISVGTIGKLERQAFFSCRGRTLARLAAALGVQPTALMPSLR